MDEKRINLIREIAEKLKDDQVKYVLITLGKEANCLSASASMSELLECFDELVNLMMGSCKETGISQFEVASKLENRLFQVLIENAAIRHDVEQEDADD